MGLQTNFLINSSHPVSEAKVSRIAKVSERELRFLNSRSLGSLATASKKDGMPHVVPVVYAMDSKKNVIIAIDYGTKKLKNLRENPRAALLVDNSQANTCIMIQGRCTLYERGPQYLKLLKILFERFEFYRENPWGEGESPILKIKPDKVVSWGV